MKYLFISFLDEYNLTGSYENMFILRNEQRQAYSSIYDFLKDVEPIDYISALHAWSKTEEGHAFWLDANSKWEQKLQIEQNEKNN